MGESLQVGIVLGSDSDLPVMQEAAETLEDLGIGFEFRILSAHRCPEAVREYATTAAGRGIRVLIAAAGGAAHLAGAIAAQTTLPVIGVPMKTAALGGHDSLLSTVQMPRGVPVATVAIDGARNGAILAAQILALSDRDLADRVAEMKAKLELDVKGRDSKLQRLGWRHYRSESK